MARIHKVEFYLVDPNDFYESEEDVINHAEVRLYEGWMMHPKCTTSEWFEWHDDIELNFLDCSEESCEKYLNKWW